MKRTNPPLYVFSIHNIEIPFGYILYNLQTVLGNFNTIENSSFETGNRVDEYNVLHYIPFLGMRSPKDYYCVKQGEPLIVKAKWKIKAEETRMWNQSFETYFLKIQN